MSDPAVCPDCGGHSFNLQIEGRQEKAAFQINDDGDRHVSQAGSVHVESHDEDRLQCRNCGTVTPQRKLVKEH